MARIQDVDLPYLEFAEGSAPGTPASGIVRAYAKTDGSLYQKDDAGVETGLAGGGGGGGGFTVVECAGQALIYAGNATTNFADNGSLGQATGSFAAKNLMQFSLSGITAVKRAVLQVVVVDFNNCLGINEGVDEWIRCERVRRTDVN